MPELILAVGFVLLLIVSPFKKLPVNTPAIIFAVTLLTTFVAVVAGPTPASPASLFINMLQSDQYASAYKALFDCAAVFTLLMSWRRFRVFAAEYYALLTSIVLGAHLLAMSTNLVMIFISLEMVSISSYILVRFSFDKASAEGSLKYFVFGSVAAALMLYGFSLLYGLSGTLDITDPLFTTNLQGRQTPLVVIGGFLSLAGLLFKVAAVPMHSWAPDVYDAAPVPVIAFFSVVPKLAGIAVLGRFILAINLYGQSYAVDWQVVMAAIAMLTLTMGNFGALWQTHPKRMMAYSSIAQTGFLLVGIAAFSPQGTQFTFFYAVAFVVANYLVFWYMLYFENATTIKDFSGLGKVAVVPALGLLVGFVALTGLPPTAGFTGKLFIFSGLWESYAATHKPVLLWLLVFGLLNTAVALFYYLRIPYYAFLKPVPGGLVEKKGPSQNLFALVLVFVILYLFFQPGVLMGWINRINFVP